MPRPRPLVRGSLVRGSLVRAAGTAGALAAVLGAGVAPAAAAGKAGGAPAAGAVSANVAGRAPVTLTLPAPTGSYPVGTVNLHLVDHSRTDPYIPGKRPRELMVQLWYPAASTAGHPAAPWLQPVAAAHFLANWHVAPGSVKLPTTAGHSGAPVAAKAGKLPVLLYSTGLHSDRAMGTSLAEDLASRGYLVVEIDHTHDANEVQFPGGRLEVNSMPPGTHSSNTIAVRAADARFVVGELASVARGGDPDVDHAALPHGLARAVDMSRIGMFGWSLGGATVPAAMHLDTRIRAGANLDGTYFGPVSGWNLDRPFLLFSSQYHNRNTDHTWAAFWSHLHGYRLDLRLIGSRHVSFSDNEEMLPQAAGVLGLSASQLRGTLGPIAPNRAVAVQRTYLAAFFDQELRGRRSSLLAGPSKSYPEIGFVR